MERLVLFGQGFGRSLDVDAIRDIVQQHLPKLAGTDEAWVMTRSDGHSQMSVSLILFDLDRFKEVNDRLGHHCGDAVLAAVGALMRDVLRGSDFKCCYGGEEFLVLRPETPLEGAKRVADTLRHDLADLAIEWKGETLNVTASFGVTTAVSAEIDIKALIGRADVALYRAKDQGRDCVRLSVEPAVA
jgi:diguanylate cyclase (GGDEF)-like protein